MAGRRSAGGRAIRVLYLGANPRRTERLDLDVELQRIKESVQSGGGVPLEIEGRLAVRPHDVQPALHEIRPHVLHFSGHATRAGGLLFQDDAGEPVQVSRDALLAVARNARGDLRAVVLNACDSEELAADLSAHVDCAIGMSRRVSDRAAVSFSVAFYLALGAGRPLEEAFQCGVDELKLLDLPEEEIPRLFTRAGVDARRVVLGAAPISRAARGARSGGLALAAALAGAAAMWSASTSRAPRGLQIEAFSREGGVVIAHAADRFPDGHPLCDDLRASAAAPEVRCISAPQALDEPALLASAADAGASLVVVIDADERASVMPLGLLAGDDLLRGGLPPEDIAGERGRRRLVPLLRAAARAATPGLGFELDPELCPPPGDGPLDRVALLTALLTPACQRYAPRPERLLDACVRAGDADWSCALARYLYARRWPDSPDIVEVLHALRDRAPERFRAPAELMLARRACDGGNVAEATEVLERLASHPAVCVRMASSEIAACLLASAPDASGGARLAAVEALAGEADAGCPPATRATILGRRAWWRARGGRWAEALADYDAAFRMRRDPLYALNAAEAELQLGQGDRAYQRLRGIEGMAEQGRDQIAEALLRWIAAKRTRPVEAPAEAELLLSRYAAYGEERPPLDEGDEHLRRLVCAGGSTVGCAHDVLSRRRTASSLRELERSLGMGGGAGSAGRDQRDGAAQDASR